MTNYSKGVQKEVKKEMHEYNKGNMIKKNQNDGIGNHPEAQKIKDICDISPSTSESE